MKDHPIIFSAPMVRAILEGKKTQTRRIVKPQPDRIIGKYPAIDDFGDLEAIRCPYGQPGDRLWVRETWAYVDNSEFDEPNYYDYKADSGAKYPGQWPEEFTRDEVPENVRWRPSIHMPRAASRILLEVADVRVERLQEISEQDAIEEGVELVASGPVLGDFYRHYADPERGLDPQSSFETLWQSLHGPESWDANPWVWVITFKRL